MHKNDWPQRHRDTEKEACWREIRNWRKVGVLPDPFSFSDSLPSNTFFPLCLCAPVAHLSWSYPSLSLELEELLEHLVTRLDSLGVSLEAALRDYHIRHLLG